MPSETVLVLLFVVATAVAIAARRLHVPYTVALVLTGLGLGGMHALAVPHVTKDLLFAVFLPGLLFEAAFHTEFDELWRNRWATFSLAVPGVIAAIAAVAFLLSPVLDELDLANGFRWSHGLVFGAVIAATDPLAVVGLFKSMGAPRRLRMLIEGESLLNDGTSIVFFTIVLGIVAGGAMSVPAVVAEFGSIVGGGAVVGGAVGLLASQVIKRVEDPMIEITITTIAAYGSFVAGDHLGFSGIIATVAAGMLCGNYGTRIGMSPSTRIAVETFWEYVAFALNSLIFLLIGFEVRLSALLSSWQPILVAYLAVTVGRFAVIAGVTALLHPTRERIPASWAAVLGWGGLRGALSMVLALGLPLGFPQRELLITMTFGVVTLSLLVQGLTMAPLLRRLGLAAGGERRTAYEFRRGQLQAVQAALEELETMRGAQPSDKKAIAAVRDSYRRRVQEIEGEIRDLNLEEHDLRALERRLCRHLLTVEKREVLEVFHQGVLSQDVYERLIADVDARLLAVESSEAPLADDEAIGEAEAGRKRRTG